MISTNSMAAFTQDIARSRPAIELRPQTPIQRAEGPLEAERVSQRKLDAVPAQPSRPLPRGSLLDLQV
jgi:hypothetical protein